MRAFELSNSSVFWQNVFFYLRGDLPVARILGVIELGCNSSKYAPT